MRGAYWTSEYWNKRVKEASNDKDMLFLDRRRDQYWANVREVLKDCDDSLDVCCGFGQFTRKDGIDFSEEMLKLARDRHPHGNYTLADATTYIPARNYTVIFEVNSLHSMRWNPDQFFEHYNDYANRIMCLEADEFTIFDESGKKVIEQKYDR